MRAAVVFSALMCAVAMRGGTPNQRNLAETTVSHGINAGAKMQGTAEEVAHQNAVNEQNANPTFRNGQPASNAFTAGGTSPPCTGLYCQDNPIGNPCPCPDVKPCRHENDGHCMQRVNINGQYSPCEYVIGGVWSAQIAGELNLGTRNWGACLCTAGTEDVYLAGAWGNCDPNNPQWCDKDGKGNACPKNNSTVVPKDEPKFSPVCPTHVSEFSNKQMEAMNLALSELNTWREKENTAAQPVRYPSGMINPQAIHNLYPDGSWAGVIVPKRIDHSTGAHTF